MPGQNRLLRRADQTIFAGIEPLVTTMQLISNEDHRAEHLLPITRRAPSCREDDQSIHQFCIDAQTTQPRCLTAILRLIRSGETTRDKTGLWNSCASNWSGLTKQPAIVV